MRVSTRKRGDGLRAIARQGLTDLRAFPAWLLARRRRVLACCAVAVIAGSILPWTYSTQRVASDVITVDVTPGVAWGLGRLTLVAGFAALGAIYLSCRRPATEPTLMIGQFTLLALCAAIGGYYLLDPALLVDVPGLNEPITNTGTVRAGVGLLMLTGGASTGVVFSILAMAEWRLSLLRGAA